MTSEHFVLMFSLGGISLKIGILGGTFNPIHIGHLIISEHIRNNFPLDKVTFIPSGDPPHKDKSELVPASKRLKMTELAIQSNPYFDISDIEINRIGKSYTIDTVNVIKSKLPNDELYFIIGGDILDELESWKDIGDVFNKISFILIGRDGLEDEDIYSKIDKYKEKYDAEIHYVKGPQIEVSSTYIRQKAGEGKSIKYLVTEEVEEYIINHGLYLMED